MDVKEDIGLLGDCLQDLGVGVDLEDVVLGFGGHFEVEVGVSDELLDVERLDAEVLLEELGELGVHVNRSMDN